MVDASTLPSKLCSEARWRSVGAVGPERAVERIEVFVWPSSDALEAMVVLLMGKSGSKVLLPKMLAATRWCKHRVILG